VGLPLLRHEHGGDACSAAPVLDIRASRSLTYLTDTPSGSCHDLPVLRGRWLRTWVIPRTMSTAFWASASGSITCCRGAATITMTCLRGREHDDCDSERPPGLRRARDESSTAARDPDAVPIHRRPSRHVVIGGLSGVMVRGHPVSTSRCPTSTSSSITSIRALRAPSSRSSPACISGSRS